MEANRLASRWNRLRAALVAMVLLGGAVAGHEASASSFTLFESGQVRPLALSPNGGFLYAVNTPDNRLEIFKVTAGTLSHVSSVPVGLEPVAVAARSDGEVWVVNHLSDSVSIVKHNMFGRAGSVVRTLLVGDEPRDIVFAGPSKGRAFITAAHRGQNVPFDPQFTTPGVGRADVWVFDSNNLGTSLGGNPLKIITLFSDTPRALAVTPDGSRVYAAAFHSGNRSTVVHEILVPNGGEAAGGVPGPNVNAEGKPAPETSVLVRFNGTDWVDTLGRSWTDKVKFSLPDKDVFVIDANANPPAQLAGTAGFYTGVGTILFNMAVNPVNGKVYVSNTEARNDLRFEGPGTFAGETLRGHLHESRISVLSSTGVAPRHLNKHINYAACCAPLPNAENDKSLAQPLGMAVSSNGTTLYVAAFGSSKIGVYSTAALEANTFVPSTTNQISVSGGGPTGMVLDESSGRMYVLTRFDNGISVINTTTRQEIAHLKMYNPEPANVVAGRSFLYDAKNSSSHGDSSCASCHIFGDFDSLVWNLGNPDGLYKVNPNPIVPVPPEFGNDPTFGQDPNFHPIKGPFSTQSLRGMSNHGPMHWRGDRTGGDTAPSAQPDSGAFNEDEAFKQFNPAFMDLLGRDAQLSPAEMQQFTDFMLQVRYPPNPVRNLDNSLTAAQQRGRDFYFDTTSFFHGSCNSCHTLDPKANPGEGPVGKGFFGTDGRPGFVATALFPKTPQLRNMYQKIGMFGVGYDFGFTPADGFMGDQIRGFGFNSDGSVDTLFRFNSGFDFHPIFNSVGIPEGPEGYQAKLDMEQFMLAFDTNLAPIVGQQVTLTLNNASVVAPRILLLVSRANAGECDLVVKGRLALTEVGFFYEGGYFKPDRQLKSLLTDTVLRQQVSTADAALTFTCTPPGSGQRIGIDRDLDGFLDGDERAAGSNPADPLSTP
ncbi:YncE family protein [Archangium violaceum]|uniref:YncE family protein n=1 Tax=Archangium violaceum TaxID=83451 RepID=UPI0036DA2FF8